jgi:hypothetical protein
MRRLIGDTNGGEAYRDDPEASASTGNEAQGPRVEPSQLIDGHSEWRD